MDGASLTILPWDTGFFGFPVARIAMSEPDDNVLATLLARCRQSGVQLVYTFLTCGANVSPLTLRDFAGLQTDQKTTLAKDLVATTESSTSGSVLDYSIAPWKQNEATPELVQLAIDSGGRSRYRVDPNLTYAQFERLYQIWIRRSVEKKIADVVLVARKANGELVGMATVSVRESVGNIGLIAVRKDQRGKEVGSSLLIASEDWMGQRGAHRTTMVTQLSNRPAVRMCERCGYAIESVQDVYHFWPLSSVARASIAA